MRNTTMMMTWIFAILGIWIGQFALLGQNAGYVFWQDGVLCHVDPQGKSTFLGSVTGAIQRTSLADGSVRYIKVPAVSPFISIPPITQQDDGQGLPIQDLKTLPAEITAAISMSRSIRASTLDNSLANSAVRLLSVLLANQGSADILDIVPSQMEKIEPLLQEFQAEIERLEQESLERPEKSQARWLHEKQYQLQNEFAKKLSIFLLADQINMLNAMSPAKIGIIRTLGESGLNEQLGLSAEENERFLKRVDEVSKRVQAEIDRSRQEILKIFDETYDEDQKRQIENLFPGVKQYQLENSSSGIFLDVITRPSAVGEQKSEPKK